MRTATPTPFHLRTTTHLQQLGIPSETNLCWGDDVSSCVTLVLELNRLPVVMLVVSVVRAWKVVRC